MARALRKAPATSDQPIRDRKMSLAGHLIELRKRFMIGGAAVVVGMIVAFFFTDRVIDVLNHPVAMVNEARGGGAQLNFTTITAGFDLRLRMSFAVGVLVSAPVWLWQAWAFIMPGLTRAEVRRTIAFLAAAIPLFFCGTAVAWVVAPHIIEVMSAFVPEQGVLFYSSSEYYDFVLKLFIALGIAFVSPVFIVALNLAGIWSAKDILKGWRVAVVIATAFAGFASPATEIMSMLVLAALLSALYFASYGVAWLLDRRKARREAEIVATA